MLRERAPQALRRFAPTVGRGKKSDHGAATIVRGAEAMKQPRQGRRVCLSCPRKILVVPSQLRSLLLLWLQPA